MKKLDIFYTLFLIVLSGYFRFTNLAQNPGIYNDEGTLLNISNNLHKGSLEYLGIQGSWLLAGRMPVFPWLLSSSYNFFEPSLLVLRGFTALSSIISVVLLFWFLKSLSDKNLLFIKYLSPLVLALHPKFVLFNRIGFGYNLLIPITILITWFFWSYLQSKNKHWIFFASIFVGIGVLIELAYIAFVVFLAILILLFDPRKLFFVIVISLTPLFLYFLISLFLFGSPFLFDWQTTFERGTSHSLFLQIATMLVTTIVSFTFADTSLLIGLLGSLAIPNRKLAIIGFFGIIVPTLVINRTFSTINQSFYYFLPYLPFVAIGISSVIHKMIEWILKFSNELCDAYVFQVLRKNQSVKWRTFIFSLILIITILGPAVLLVLDLDTQARHKFRTSFDHLLIDISEFSKIIDFVNTVTKPMDTIIASPAIAWAIQANTTDYQISIAVNEQPTIHFPNGIPKERMRFQTDIENARYVIIDSITRSWEDEQIPGIYEWIQQIETQWIPVFKTTSLVVYQNPQLLTK